jgi:hypothetical protein
MIMRSISRRLGRKISDKLKKIKGNERKKVERQMSEDFTRKYHVTMADLELGTYWLKKEKHCRDMDR